MEQFFNMVANFRTSKLKEKFLICFPNTRGIQQNSKLHGKPVWIGCYSTML